jgi:putative Mn2+ efflux pump MntP
VAGRRADYVAIEVLIGFGAYARPRRRRPNRKRKGLADDRARGHLLGLSISIEGLAIGFTLGLLRLSVVPVVVLIPPVFMPSQLGLALGDRLPGRIRDEAAARLGRGSTKRRHSSSALRGSARSPLPSR